MSVNENSTMWHLTVQNTGSPRLDKDKKKTDIKEFIDNYTNIMRDKHKQE